MFGTSGIRGQFGEDVTAATAVAVGRAVGSDGVHRAVVGRDPRTTGPLLVDALSAGLRECGVDVGHLGELPTPTVARAVDWYDADIGIAVTASHNPPTDNGLKLWAEDGAAISEAEQRAIETRVEQDDYELQSWDCIGQRYQFTDARGRHVDAVVDTVEIDPPLSIVVDVGHGSGRLTAAALRRLGCAVTTLNGVPEGGFPARESEPTPESCRQLSQVVASTDADLGVAHDGDADRMLAVTESGEFVPGDVLLALFARDEATAGSRVAVPVDTSMIVSSVLAAVGADVARTAVGDGHVAQRTKEPDVVFGGEPSGAWIWPEDSRCPDGTLAAAKLAAMVARDGSLDALVNDVPTVPISRRQVECTQNDHVLGRIADAMPPDDERVTMIDGIRVDVDDGWFLVRASGTEPLIRITAEARNREQMESLRSTAETLVSDAMEIEPADQRR